MITDDMLRDAAVKANAALLSAFPDTRECRHEFSRRFKRKMRRLIRHTKHPVVYKVLKNAACFLLISLLAAAMLLSTNAKAREAFFDWVKKTYEYFIEYYFDGLVNDDAIEYNEMTEYRLGWIPEGYVESEVLAYASSTTIIYNNNTNNLIQFNYICNPNTSNLLVFDKDIYNHYNISINNITADIYISNTPNNSNLIIWSNSNSNIMFTISAFFDKSDLIKMAETIITSEITGQI